MDLNKILGLIKNVLDMVAPQLKKETSTVGTKESREAVAGVMELSVCMAERLKDGIGLDDLSALWAKWQTDPILQGKLKAAVDGVGAVQAEAEDMDAGEAVELVADVVDYVPKFLDALKPVPPSV